MITDLLPGEVVFVPVVDGRRTPAFQRCRFVKIAPKPVTIPQLKCPFICLIVTDEHGKEIKLPVRYVFKSSDDALDKASEMVR